jgi:tRNA threonylcarbamoyladenosine biosynthesis protein TsaE
MPTGCVFLQGDLGAGKTCLVRGWLQALGHQGAVKSPTYTLVEPYQLQGRQIYHFDLYRLRDPEELDLIGGRDYFDDDVLCLVEWPDKGAGFLPPARLIVELSVAGAGRQAHLTWS